MDVIVVGAGAAGAAAARRLHDAGASVLLLEAGGPDLAGAIHDPARAHELWFAPEDWAYHTQPQAAAGGRRLHWPRGRVLGGSTSLNAMIYVRGAREDYDAWADAGATGWSWDDVAPDFDRIEAGPLHVDRHVRVDPIHTAIVEAACSWGLPLNEDYNDGTLDGVSTMHLTIRDGRRCSTAAAYLAPVADSARLQVLTRARARRVLLDGTRCTGVEYVRDGRTVQVRADDVILAGGTLESPRILMASGIGPAEALAALGVDVVADLRGVGANLHDHLLAPVIFATTRPVGAPSPGLGPAQTHLWWRSRPGLRAPDTQPIHFMAPMYEPWMSGPPDGFTLMAGMVAPASRGTLRLSGPEPDDELLIDPMILTAPEDLDALCASVRQCREIGAQATLAEEWGARELYPGPTVRTDAQLREYVRRTALTYHHQVGTCRMGISETAVVDPKLKVYGIDGLRVADASVMPVVPSGNTMAPSILIGERAATCVW
ncbi:GMC family oxidoreductase [Conexibacter woesei]|uniref:GMC family oxidoreductase n=1 Tax=Conexibacter woesei TaxID=191495 RepID=UPI0004276859|nr:GMC family oxidoreductase N-terminal domain-containing protein [Conexibacter woesei]